MFSFPGRRVIVSLVDGDMLTAVTAWSWRCLRLRDVELRSGAREPIAVDGTVVLPASAIVMVQVVA